MPTKYESRIEEYYAPEALPKLQAYFGLVRKGRDKVLRTHIFENQDVGNVIQNWLSHLEPISREWPSLFQYEIDLSKKVGPMSIMKPLKDRMKDIDAYYDGISLPSEPINESALDLVCSEWSGALPLRIRSQKNTVDNMKLSTSSGSPFHERKRFVVGDTIPCTLVNNDPYVVQELPNSNWYACAELGWRGQEGGPALDDTKQRVVWMFPFSVNVTELQLYQPLIAGAQKHDIQPSWISQDATDQRITRMFDSKGSKDLVICTDFTKFDQHFGIHCQEGAEYILRSLFRYEPSIESWLHDIFPLKYIMPLMYDYNKFRFGRHGMGSGSGGTNADETLVHRALQYEAAMLNGKKLNPYSQCLGDDGVLTYPGITVEGVIDAYTSHGLEMNPDKQEVSIDHCTYLRRWYHTDYRDNGICVGVYSTARALGRLIYRERHSRSWTSTDEVMRSLSILENVKHHPLKEELIAYVLKGDPYRLGLGIPGFFDNLESKLKKAIANGAVSDWRFHTYSEPTSINDWWIVKYLKAKR